MERGGGIVNRIFTVALTMGGQFGVALFFMITGYFMIDDDNIRLKRIFCETLYYGILTIGIFAISYIAGYRFAELSLGSIIKGLLNSVFLPISGGSWWFVSTYVALMLLHSLINKFVRRMNKRGFVIFLVLVWFLWYTLGSCLDATYHSILKGVFFYLVGGYIKKYRIYEVIKGKEILFGLSLVSSVLLYTIVAYVGFNCRFYETLESKLIVELTDNLNSSIIIMVSSVSLFLLLTGIDIGSVKLVNEFSRTTFAVYLISDSVVARSLIWRGIFKVDTYWYSLDCFPIVAILIIFLVFLVCSLIDILRVKYIERHMLGCVDSIIDKLVKMYCV